MKMLAVFMLVLLLLAIPCLAQDGRSASYTRYAERHEMNTPRLYSGNGTFLGELSSNRYAPNSILNPYGVYGSRYSPQSIRNPHGPYGIYSAQPIYVLPRNK